MKKHGPFLVFIGLLVVVLSGFIAYQERIMIFGEEVILATRPVDPRDFLRGDYVILRYEIEDVAELLEAEGASISTEAATVYVQVEADSSGVSQATAIALEPTQEGVWLKGEMNQRGIVRFESLEQYFVPEGTGREIERVRNDIFVKVRAYKGESRIVELLDQNFQVIDPKTFKADES